MSKKWEATHTAADGTPLMLEDGKLYSQWNWDNFGPAYRGEAREIRLDTDWGADEVTEDVPPKWQVWFGGGDCLVTSGAMKLEMDGQLLSHYVSVLNAGDARRMGYFASQIGFMLEQAFKVDVEDSEAIALMDSWRIAENK